MFNLSRSGIFRKRLFICLFLLSGIVQAKSPRLDIITSITKMPKLMEQAPGDDHAILNLTHPPLVMLNKSWQWQCLVCKSIPNRDDDTLKTKGRRRSKKVISQWEINPEYFWSNGEPVTGYDVKRTINLLRPRLTHINKMIKDIKIDSKDPRKFKVIFRSFRSTFPQLFAIRLIPRNQSLEMTYGPYKIQSWEQNTVKLRKNRFSRNIGWHFSHVHFLAPARNRKLIFTKKVAQTTIVMPSAMPTDAQLLTKNLHDKKDQVFDFHSGASPVLETLYFNLRNPGLTNVRVRQTLAKALDTVKITKQVYGDNGFAASTFSHPSDPICPVQLPPKATDSAKMELPKKLEITFLKSPEKNAIFKALVAAWTPLGIKVIKKEVSQTFYANRVLKESHFQDLALVSWHTAPGTIPINFFYSKSIPSYGNGFRGQNLTGWVNRDVDSLLKKLHRAKSPESITNICTQLQIFFNADQPMIPIAFKPFSIATTKDLKGFFPVQHLYSVSLFGQNWRKDREEF